jgi:hypothetical protein
MATTNDAMYEALVLLYPDAGKTLGDLLYTHWSEVGLDYRGTLERDYYIEQGASGTTLGDLANDFWSEDYINLLSFNYDNYESWLQNQIFDHFDTVEEETIIG